MAQLELHYFFLKIITRHIIFLYDGRCFYTTTSMQMIQHTFSQRSIGTNWETQFDTTPHINPRMNVQTEMGSRSSEKRTLYASYFRIEKPNRKTCDRFEVFFFHQQDFFNTIFYINHLLPPLRTPFVTFPRGSMTQLTGCKSYATPSGLNVF